MPNEPKFAAEKRPPRAVPRKNAQSDHEGSAHRPEEFKAGELEAGEIKSGAPDLSPEQKRAAPQEIRNESTVQDTEQDSDAPLIPRSRNFDSTISENRDHSGRINKRDDC
ncbi:hypothetical protein [Szabonella alba]|uniref:Uncharacterized protein n=1 Tax=Szabonella alba TaxID=2804194 RepID=A0A8K0VBK2_9RHOB|nr:hypothetical protein [Szabonella alba]MBL4918908.1 hypothetical protein [Szabonella alba]